MRTYQATQQGLFEQPRVRPDRATLKNAILTIIDHEEPLKARQIAYRLSKKFGVTIYRHDVNSIIYSELRRDVRVVGPDFRVVRYQPQAHVARIIAPAMQMPKPFDLRPIPQRAPKSGRFVIAIPLYILAIIELLRVIF